MENSMLFSERVCNHCARRIRNLEAQSELVQSSIGSEAASCQTSPKESIDASERLLETPPSSNLVARVFVSIL